MNILRFFKGIMSLSLMAWCLSIQAQQANPLDNQNIRFSLQQQQTMGIQVANLRDSSSIASQSLPAEVVIPTHQQRIVSAVQGGLIESISTAVGSLVKQGQVLGYMTSSQLLAPQQQYLQARIQQQLAQKTHERDAELYQEGIIAERRYLASKSQLDEIRANSAQLQQLLKLSGMGQADISQLEKTGRYSTKLPLIAPIDGEIIEQSIAVGQRVETSSLLFKVAKLQPLWLELRVPIEQATRITQGTIVRVPKLAVEGSVINVIRSLNKQDQTVLVRAEVSQNTAQLSPGQYVETEVIATQDFTQKALRFSLPKPAISWHRNQAYIFIKTPNGFRPVAVTVLSEQGQSATIEPNNKQDLTGRELVVIAGTVAIKAAWESQQGAQ